MNKKLPCKAQTGNMHINATCVGKKQINKLRTLHSCQGLFAYLWNILLQLSLAALFTLIFQLYFRKD